MTAASSRSFAWLSSRRGSAITIVFLAFACGRCASAVVPAAARDAASDTDARPSADALVRDGADAGEDDAFALPPCDPAAIVDLNARGTRVGEVTRYVGSNAAAAVEGAVYVQSQPEAAFAPVVHRYTPQHTTRLLLSLDNPGTPESFLRGRVWILDRCTSMQTAQLFDSSPPAGAYAGPSLIVHAGVPVFIVVAGQYPRLTSPYELSVTELEVVGVGEPCSLAPRPTNTCIPNSTCDPQAIPSTGTCVADGSDGRPCRTEGLACDAGLACGAYDGRGPLCGPAHGVGGQCFPGVCVEGTYCAGGTCLAYGALEQQCRDREPACDNDLICVGYTCHQPAALGQMCLEGTGWGPKCVEGLSCVNRVCVPDGSRSAACRTSGTPCDSGLGCVQETTVCLPLTTLGGDCPGNCCPANSHCEHTHCVSDGLLGGACRAGADACDPGLACVGHWYGFPGVDSDFTDENTCQPVHEGDHCAFFMHLACPRWTYCAGPSPATATCRAPTGALDQPCRTAGSACDAGLFCQSANGGGWLAPRCVRYE